MTEPNASRRGSRFLPLGLLLLTGGLLGVSTNIAKIAGEWGLEPLAFLVWSIAGATVVLFAVGVARSELPAITRRTVEYFIVAAFVTVAASNLIFFSAVPRVGAGFVSLAIAFPPLLTYLGALALRLESFSATRAGGVGLALTGAAVLAWLKLAEPNVSAFWIGLVLLGPVLLAIGNIYRSVRWPPGSSADSLAPGMLLAATGWLFLAGLLPGFSLVLPYEPWAIGLTLAQAGLFAAQFLLLFALQRAGGPVLLSLLGSVGALVGVPVAVLLLGEAVPNGLLVAVPLITAGIAAVTYGGMKEAVK